MDLRPVNDPYGGNAVLVDKMIGSAFKTVRAVADSLEQIKYIVDNMQAIVQVGQGEENLNDLATAGPAALAAAQAATTAAAQATALLNGVLTGLNASGALVTPTGGITAQTLADMAATVVAETPARVAADGAIQAGITAETARAQAAELLFAPRIATISALRAITTLTVQNPVIYLTGYSILLDGGEGTFTYVATDTTSADNGGTIIVDASGRRWYRARSGSALMLSWFGANAATANCTTALLAALNALPAGGGEIKITSNTLTFGSNVSFTYPAGPFSLTLSGEGADSSVLLWPANGGLTLNASNYKHTFHIKDLSFRAGLTPTGTGLTLNQSQPGGSFGRSDIVRTTFNGTADDRSFNYAVQVLGWCNINYECDIYSALATGISLKGALATSFKYSIIHNMNRCNFFGCATNIIYDSYAQGLTVTQTNFVNGVTGILVPPGATGALSQLQVSDCEFTLTGHSINIQATIGEVQIHDNLIIVPDNFIGIVVNAAVGYSSLNDNIFVTNSLDGNSAGITVTSTSSIGVITGNVFEGLSTGILLGASTQEWNVQSNKFHDCTTNIINSGTGNTIGGGST